MGWLLALILVTASAAAQNDFHSQLSSEELQTYFGVGNTENVPAYELVSPVHVQGSHDRPSLFASKDDLRYNVSAFGETFHLHLQHNDHLIGPGCLLHQLGANGTGTVRPCPTQQDDCYYHGTVLNNQGSGVALSTCNGLTGLIRLPDRQHDVWIQPIEERHVARARRSTGGGPLSHPHIAYKRATTGHHCGTEGTPEVTSLVNDVMTMTSRHRRQTGGSKVAEMMMVADHTMHDRYGDDLRRYMLTVANVAARVLLDASIGTPIHFSVVKIQILETEQAGLEIVEDADTTLDSFCRWQERSNPSDDSNPQHHDGAALLTRLDLVHSGVRDTTGFATVGGMCGRETRCSVNEDNGVGVGLTLAHETGHTLGMVHDGSGNGCENGKNIMSSMGGGGHSAMLWSQCSRQSLANFLASSRSHCLNDRAGDVEATPKDLPGVVYDGDEQCQMYMGAGSTICLGTDMVRGDECTHLVCFDPKQPGTCKGDSVPRMDGTMCGNRKYCVSGQCVDIGPNGPQPRNGGWSAWEPQWSACSRTCGGGVRIRRRKCDNPKPRLGGLDCAGSAVMAEMCNMKDCSSSEKEFRKEQCAKTDNSPLYGQTHHWLPVNMMGEQQCELHCQIEGQRTVMLRQVDGKSWYQDGTACVPTNSPFGRCVDGKCQEFGCDGKTGSTFKYDVCGVCGGRADTCQKQSGTYTRGRKNEYVTFLRVPKGSASVKITNDNRFTQMSVKVGGKRVFNEVGGSTDQSGSYSSDGVDVYYRTASSGQETISIIQPLSQSVETQVWRKFADTEYQGVAPQINYEYYVPTSAHPYGDYQWAARNGACTRSCGGGVYHQIITCTRGNNGGQVDEHFCDIRQKPALTGSACNNQACPPRWRTGRFGQCSQSCGGGRQTRPVDCVQDRGGEEVVVTLSRCPANRRPTNAQQCNVGVACPAVWRTGDWSACSMTCGKGVHSRSVKCVADDSSGQEVSASRCSGDSKPADTEACVVTVCSPEITGDACKDTDSACSNYGLTMCKDYASFAQTSCQRHCAFCSPDGSVGGACENKNDDCERYGKSICTGDYAGWAEDNCAKLCGYCQVSQTTTCQDKLSNCAAYGQNVCAEYGDWATENCANFCGQCSSAVGNNNNNNPATTLAAGSAAGSCSDKDDNCQAYGQSVCSEYAGWANEHCQHFCNLCPSTSTTMHCEVYQDIDLQHGVRRGSCVDKSGDCQGYGSTVCASYADWARDNCQKFCNLCGQRRKRSVLTPPPRPLHSRPLCNNVLTDVTGSLKLIGQPVDSKCTQIIVGPMGSRVQISFPALNISCENGDWLEVREDGGKQKGEKTRHDLCDQKAPVQWTTTGNMVTVKLSTDTPGHGYNLNYTILESQPIPGCHRLLTDPTGALASPDFPEAYPADKLCMTSIVAPPNFAVRITFHSFHLDGKTKCHKDSLTLSDEESRNLDVFCGAYKDLTWQSKGNRVKVVFASGPTAKGFLGYLASYKFVPKWLVSV